MNANPADAFDGAARWILTQCRPEGAAFARGEPPRLMATAFAVLALEGLDRLDLLEPLRREHYVAMLVQAQDPATGLFAAATVSREECSWTSHGDPAYIRMQLTYFCLAALHALGQRPPAPLAFATPFRDPAYARGWLDGGPWDNPWNQSNRVMFLLRFLIELAQADAGYMAIYDEVLEYLAARQDARTGVWKGTANASVREGLFAGYHFFPFYFWRGSCPPHPERVLDAALAIQHADGLFGACSGGSACEDLDAVDTLVKFSLVSNHRAGEVRDALARALRALLACQTPDGGFRDQSLLPEDQPRTWRRRAFETTGLHRILRRPLPIPAIYYGGWRQLRGRKGESDMWAAWFRPLAIATILSRYPEWDPGISYAFHKLPCLGWHDAERVRSARPYCACRIA